MDFASTSEPPFEKAYQTLFVDKQESIKPPLFNQVLDDGDVDDDDKKCELPLIDISRLNDYNKEGCLECKREIISASKEWGFFQVVNHGISREVLEKTREEQVKFFRQTFESKTKVIIRSRLDVKKMMMRSGSITNSINNSSEGSCSSNNEVDMKKPIFGDDIYRWGTPTATSLDHFSWSEAFHIPLSSYDDDVASHPKFKVQRFIMEEFAMKVSSLADRIAEILAESLGHGPEFFKENCLPNTCYLRLNRYPPCPFPSQVFGLMPHTDSDFLTVLYQDHVGGLQLVKNGSWITVKPNPDALVINIGDLFQAWSNDVYKSVEHRVIANRQVERYSMAYFYCPSYDTVIRSCVEPPIYRDFSFKEYREQVQEDVRTVGYKVGLLRFLQ
ncbi:hypothetical protein Scep_013052 [Stephania cephalantha]|uniref:Fe2OG dioxygenase domain-containing protein n=1 Tax=Stephania cephalantha TaxID=152367 RepID=A0AAP0P854_9MAGN